MKITILGSTGFVGKVLLEKALARGYEVKTLVRDPEKLGGNKERVEVVVGKASQLDKLDYAVTEVETVLSTLPPDCETKIPDKSTRAMENIVKVLERKGVKRFIHIGGAVHGGGTDEIWSLDRRFLRFYLNLVCKPVLIGKESEWEVLRKSNLNWTLVRPPRVMDGSPKGNLAAYEKKIASVQVNVENLADFILDQITSEEWIRKAPLVATVKS